MTTSRTEEEISESHLDLVLTPPPSLTDSFDEVNIILDPDLKNGIILQEDYQTHTELPEIPAELSESSLHMLNLTSPENAPPTARHVNWLTIDEDDKSIPPSAHKVVKAYRIVKKLNPITLQYEEIKKTYFVKYITADSPIGDIEVANAAHMRAFNHLKTSKSRLLYDDEGRIIAVVSKKLEGFNPIKENPLRFEDIVIEPTADLLNNELDLLIKSLDKDKTDETSTYYDIGYKYLANKFKAWKAYEANSQVTITAINAVKKAVYHETDLITLKATLDKRKLHIEGLIASYKTNVTEYTKKISTSQLTLDACKNLIAKFEEDIQSKSALQNLSFDDKKKNDIEINKIKERLRLQQIELAKLNEENSTNYNAFTKEQKLLEAYENEATHLDNCLELIHSLKILNLQKINVIHYEETLRLVKKRGYNLQTMKKTVIEKGVVKEIDLDPKEVIEITYQNKVVKIELKYLRNYARVAEVASGHMLRLGFSGDDDGHILNFGDWGFNIDHDMGEWDFSYPHKETSIADRFLRIPSPGSHELSIRDIEHCPNFVDAKFYYNPCVASLGTSSKISFATAPIPALKERLTRNAYTEEQSKVFQSLENHEGYRFNAYKTFLAIALLPVKNYEESCRIAMRSKYQTSEQVDENMIKHKVAKIARFRERLFATSAFKKFLEQYGDYAFDAIIEQFNVERNYYRSKAEQDGKEYYSGLAESYQIEELKEVWKNRKNGALQAYFERDAKSIGLRFDPNQANIEEKRANKVKLDKKIEGDIILSEETNFYQILKLEKNAELEDVKAAYKKMVFKWHPDKNKTDPSATDVFSRIKAAYDTLSDEGKRIQYNKEIGIEVDFEPIGRQGCRK